MHKLYITELIPHGECHTVVLRLSGDLVRITEEQSKLLDVFFGIRDRNLKSTMSEKLYLSDKLSDYINNVFGIKHEFVDIFQNHIYIHIATD